MHEVSVERAEQSTEYHAVWHVIVNGKTYVVSYVLSAFDTGLPECMAFPCNDSWKVTSFAEKACSYNRNSEQALKEVVNQLANGTCKRACW